MFGYVRPSLGRLTEEEKVRFQAAYCGLCRTMGRRCGYLALMSGIATGAEQVYLSETGVTLKQLSDDTHRMVDNFKRGRNLYLVVRNEEASEYYTADVMTPLFQAEGHGLFDVRTAILLAVLSVPFDPFITEWMGQAAVPEARGRNVVNVIIVDFRALDTLGEIAVLLRRAGKPG